MQTCDFCQIRDGALPARIVHRDENVLAFEDTRPQAPVHVLFIPLEHVETANDFSPQDATRIGQLFLAATQVAKARATGNGGTGWSSTATGTPGSRSFMCTFTCSPGGA
jgi:histidine triad (HIT) family protein